MGLSCYSMQRVIIMVTSSPHAPLSIIFCNRPWAPPSWPTLFLSSSVHLRTDLRIVSPLPRLHCNEFTFYPPTLIRFIIQKSKLELSPSTNTPSTLFDQLCWPSLVSRGLHWNAMAQVIQRLLPAQSHFLQKTTTSSRTTSYDIISLFFTLSHMGPVVALVNQCLCCP